MKERPILFSAPMVRAILAGTKTQTRRVVKPQPPRGTFQLTPYHHPDKRPRFFAWKEGFGGAEMHPGWEPIACPYGQPGDRLLVCSEIPGVGRAYCAGTDGVIYSRARGDWRPLKAHLNVNGYPCVTVMLDGRKTTRAVHSLVCSAFYGPPPFDGAQVRHLDGDPQHNVPANLCWGTQAENWQDRRAHGNGIEGEKHHAAKLTDDERAHLRWTIERGLCSQHHAARILGMTQSAVGEVMLGAELRANMLPDAGLRITRITLEITSVRVERLQAITRGDAMAEGCPFPNMASGPDPRDWYRGLWSQINGPDSWTADPWVWVIAFKRLEAA